MTKKQHYLSRSERDMIEAWLRAGKSKAWIARELGVCRQTVYNEVKRGLYNCIEEKSGYYYDVIRYSAEKAQQLHDYNQTAKGRPLKIGHDFGYAQFLESLMLGVQKDGHIEKKRRYSPATALAEARKAGFAVSICVTTLYSYIDKGVFLHLTNKDLWEKGQRKKRGYQPVRRVAHPLLPSITSRPEEINLRCRRGDWEMDLVIGKRNVGPCLLTLYERYSRQVLIFKLPNKKAATIRGVFDQLEAKLPDFRERFKTVTTDNGSEFLEYEALRQSIRGGTRFDVYYCHSYAAWEKGGNERHNRMIRRWFPKGTDFSKVSRRQIAELQEWMNNYPRKILGWKTPNEMAA